MSRLSLQWATLMPATPFPPYYYFWCMWPNNRKTPSHTALPAVETLTMFEVDMVAVTDLLRFGANELDDLDLWSFWSVIMYHMSCGKLLHQFCMTDDYPFWSDDVFKRTALLSGHYTSFSCFTAETDIDQIRRSSMTCRCLSCLSPFCCEH